MEIRPNVREARDLRGMVTMVWRRKWVVLAPVLAGLLAGFVIGHPKVLPPVYESTARILVDFPAPVTKDLQGILPSSGMQEQIARLSALVQSNDFLLKVASQSRLREDPEVKAWVNSNARRYPGLSQEELENICIPELLRHWIGLRIAENILTIRVVHADPLRAQDLAQRVATGVIEANSSAQLERVKEMYRFSEMQMAVYKQELADAEKSLDDAKRSAALGALRASGNSAGLTEVRRLRDEASSESARLSTEEQRLRRSIQSKAPSALAALPSAGGPAYSRVVEQVKDLERKYAEAAADPYGSQNDAETYAVLTAQALGDLQQEAIEQWEGGNAIPASVRSDAAALLVTQARMAGVRERLGALDRAISRSESSVTGTPAIETEVQRLTREVENKRALYNAFVNQLASSKIGEAFVGSMEQGRMSILEPPARPLSPIKPNRPVILVLGGIIGLLLGIAALAIVERQDPTFRDSREAERALGIRVIGTLPQLDMLGAAKDRPHWTQQAFDRFLGDSPAYQEMRRIALELRNDEDAPVRSLLITSTRGGEGKTTACILLGSAIATEEPRVPVLLVDIDLRRGALGRMLGAEPHGPGLIQALETRRLDDASFRKTPVPNLHVLSLGGHPQPRNDLLTFENIAWLVTELTRRYGVILIDSPPNLPVPDALIIGQVVDAVLIVVKAGRTPRAMVERGVELQKQFTGNLRGLLMNNVDETMPYYYNHRYYGYQTARSSGR